MADIPYWDTDQDIQRFLYDGPGRLTSYQGIIFGTVKDSGNTGCTTNKIKATIVQKVHKGNDTALDNWMYVKTLNYLEDEKIIQIVQNRWKLHPSVRIVNVIIPRRYTTTT